MFSGSTALSFYDIGGHFLFYLMITAHICVFFDISHWRRAPVSAWHLTSCACLAAWGVSWLTKHIDFGGSAVEMSAGIVIAVIFSLAACFGQQGLSRHSRLTG